MEIQCAKEIINSLLLLRLFKEVLSALPVGGRGRKVNSICFLFL
jgi:hypothetical protein